MNRNRLVAVLLALFVVLMSLPWLVPGCGWTALIGFVPLLCAERVASLSSMKRTGLWIYLSFLVWNLVTTWWVCNASVGGGIFASVYTALMMTLIFGLFRLARSRFGVALPYVLLAAVWIAWERFLLTSSQISWPWLVLGNAFARTTRLVQWYEVTGPLGGSLWIWGVNISLFAILSSVSEGTWMRMAPRARRATAALVVIFLLGPAAASLVRYYTYEEDASKGRLDVVAVQPNYDPWGGKLSLPQSVQTSRALTMLGADIPQRFNPACYPDSMLLILFPETFTCDVWQEDVKGSPTWQKMMDFEKDYPNTNIIFGAVSRRRFLTAAPPSMTARPYGNSAWYEAYNTAFITDTTGRYEKYYKSKLVVGTESLPYPKLLKGIDDRLGGVAGHYVTQANRSPLNAVEYDSTGLVRRRIPIGTGICYESVYGEHMSGFTRAGAQALAIITNDGWWGNTAGHVQHYSFSRLRAIENRRDLVRAANTGISAIIDQRGDVVSESAWWQAQTLAGTVNLSEARTPFVRYGDMVGRVCVLVSLLSILALAVRLLIPKR